MISLPPFLCEQSYGVVELKVNDPSGSPFANPIVCGVLLKTLPALAADTVYNGLAGKVMGVA
jgi:hypothetical protein